MCPSNLAGFTLATAASALPTLAGLEWKEELGSLPSTRLVLHPWLLTPHPGADRVEAGLCDEGCGH